MLISPITARRCWVREEGGGKKLGRRGPKASARGRGYVLPPKGLGVCEVTPLLQLHILQLRSATSDLTVHSDQEVRDFCDVIALPSWLLLTLPRVLNILHWLSTE
jgi:hypothetical protein